MHVTTAQFLSSAPNLDGCPDESLPEFAFAGRSNVGKSSLINLIVGQRNLANVSATPGHTRHLNFFTINGSWRLVDLPGYGYARVEREERGRFSSSVAEYLTARGSLQLVFTLVDSSVPLPPNDREFIEWLVDEQVPFVVVFTKTDKAGPEKLEAHLTAFREWIGALCETPPMILTTSSARREGRQALLSLIGSVLPPENRKPRRAPPPRRDTPW